MQKLSDNFPCSPVMPACVFIAIKKTPTINLHMHFQQKNTQSSSDMHSIKRQPHQCRAEWHLDRCCGMAFKINL